MTINTNINALVAGNAYAAAAVDYAQATQRISTQLRVNSAKDDPVGIGMASALKAKIASYAKAADNINSGISNRASSRSSSGSGSSSHINSRTVWEPWGPS